MHNTTNPTQLLSDFFNDLAVRIIDHGTLTETRLLTVMAAALRDSAPGIAEALVDRSGSEVARLRAFGKAASRLVGLADVIDHRYLIADLDGSLVDTVAA
ncbi:hypothetical protein BH24ACT5_BH24ACT5_14320 [soil metagenome]